MRRFFVGLFRLTFATTVFFALLGVASYYAIAWWIRGEEIPAPDVRTLPVAEALEVLKENNLSLVLEREEPNNILAEGEIVSQQPRPGSMIKARTPIRVVVSSGPRLIRIPETLIGMSRREAGIRLRELGLEVGNVTQIPKPGQAPDTVLALDPPAGAAAPPRSKVNLLVTAAAAGQSFTMPDLYGLTPEQAAEELARYGMAIGRIREEPAPGVPAGRIHKQEPESGRPVGADREVELVITPVI